VEHIARMGNVRDVCKVLVGEPKRKRPLERILLQWPLMKQNNVWSGLSWLKIGFSGRLF